MNSLLTSNLEALVDRYYPFTAELFLRGSGSGSRLRRSTRMFGSSAETRRLLEPSETEEFSGDRVLGLLVRARTKTPSAVTATEFHFWRLFSYIELAALAGMIPVSVSGTRSEEMLAELSMLPTSLPSQRALVSSLTGRFLGRQISQAGEDDVT